MPVPTVDPLPRNLETGVLVKLQRAYTNFIKPKRYFAPKTSFISLCLFIICGAADMPSLT